MKPAKIMLIASLIVPASLSTSASAQSPGFRYPAPQPRVHYAPPSRGSRDAYIMGGTIAGGYLGLRRGGDVGGLVGGAVGGYVGGRYYDRQNTGTNYYYYPREYGVQTSTPYMIRRRGH